MLLTMKKVIIGIVLSIMFLLMIVGLNGCSAENIDFTFVQVDDFFVVTGGVPDSEGHLAIPARHRGLDVIAINYSAF